MTSPRAAASPPVELKPASSRGLRGWLRDVFRRGTARARLVAPRHARLGVPFEVEWGVDCPGGGITGVSVRLVGTELARRFVSARQGISVQTETSDFLTVDIAHASPEPGLRVAYGRASIAVPRDTVPSLPGRHNEIAWAIVVDASFQSAPGLSESFPIIALPGDT